jgi:hypothetical protein
VYDLDQFNRSSSTYLTYLPMMLLLLLLMMLLIAAAAAAADADNDDGDCQGCPYNTEEPTLTLLLVCL